MKGDAGLWIGLTLGVLGRTQYTLFIQRSRAVSEAYGEVQSGTAPPCRLHVLAFFSAVPLSRWTCFGARLPPGASAMSAPLSAAPRRCLSLPLLAVACTGETA